MLNDNDQYKLRERSTWDEDSREWTVPLFILHKMQDEVAFPTIGAKARVSQARNEREVEFRVDGNGRFIDSAKNSRSRSGYNRRDGGTFSEQNGDPDNDSLHDPDMQWNKFGNKNNSLAKNHNKSSQMNNEMNGNSTMRHQQMNNDKIDGVHDRRNKYLGANNGASGANNGDDSASMERSKPYSKHLQPLSPSNGSGSGGPSGRGVSTGPSAGGAMASP